MLQHRSYCDYYVTSGSAQQLIHKLSSDLDAFNRNSTDYNFAVFTNLQAAFTIYLS